MFPALWRRRCRAGRIDVNPRHEDFPALLAEALDVLCGTEDDLKAGSSLLGCSPSQLIKFLKEGPRAWGQFNERPPGRRTTPARLRERMPPARRTAFASIFALRRRGQRRQLFGGQLLERASVAL